ncbi:Uncharacterized protein TCAP_02071 [Tolypocladium capitatum]|uniref:Glycosyl transferase n=1 Tax=Tolypocladium capitatum TaxID=45235 RepID=A0A2K3QKE6_9HYPO|nr:Uncharacterized protein TCAP_02071 [Tolypocladium capitatum]
MTSFFPPGSNDPTINACGVSGFQVYCNAVLPAERLLQTWHQKVDLALGAAALGTPVLIWLLLLLRRAWALNITKLWGRPKRRAAISRDHDGGPNATPLPFESTKSFRIYSATECQSGLGDTRQYDLSVFPLTATGRGSREGGGLPGDSRLAIPPTISHASSMTAATTPTKMNLAYVDLGTIGPAAFEDDVLNHTANFLADICPQNDLAGLAIRPSTSIEPQQVERLIELLYLRGISVLLLFNCESEEVGSISFVHASGIVIENATILRSGQRRDYFQAKRLRYLMGRCGKERETRPEFFIGFLELWRHRPHPSVIRRALRLAEHFGAVLEHGPDDPKIRSEAYPKDASRTLSGFEYLRRADVTELQRCWTSDSRKVWVPNGEPEPELKPLPLQDLDSAIPYASHFLNSQSLPSELSAVRDERPTLSHPPEYVAMAPKRSDFWEVSADGIAFSRFGCFSLVAEPSAEDYVAVVETQCHLKELQMLHAVTGTETNRLLEEMRRLAGQGDCGDLVQELVEGLESQQVCVFKGLDTGFRVPEGEGHFWGVAKARDGQTKLAIDIFISQAAPNDASTVLHTWLAHHGVHRSARLELESLLEKANGLDHGSGLPLSMRTALERATDAERLQVLQQMRVSQLNHRFREPIVAFCRSILIDKSCKYSWNQFHARGLLDGSMTAEGMFRTRLEFFARCGATELPRVQNLVALYELVERTIHDALFFGDREPLNAFANALLKAFNPGSSSSSNGYVDVNADLLALIFFSILRKAAFEEVYIESTDRCPIFLACPDQAAVFSELWVLGSQCEIFLGLLPSDLGEIIYKRYKDFLGERPPVAGDRENNEIMTMYSSSESPPPSKDAKSSGRDGPHAEASSTRKVTDWKKRFTEFGAMSIFCLPAIVDVLLLTFVGRGMFMTAYMEPPHLQAAGFALLISLLLTAGITGWVGSTGSYYLAHYAYDNMTYFHVQRLSGGFALTCVVGVCGLIGFTVEYSVAVGFVFVAFLIVITTYLNLLGVMATMHQPASPITSGRTVLWRTIPVLLLSPIISSFINGHDLIIYLPVAYTVILLLLYQYRQLCREWTGWMKNIPDIANKDVLEWYMSTPESQTRDMEKTENQSEIAQEALRTALVSYTRHSRGAVSSGLMNDKFVGRVARGMPYIDWLFKKTNPDANVPDLFSGAWYTQLGEAKKQQQQVSRGLKEHNIMLLFRNARYDLGQNLGLFLVALMDRWVSIIMGAREPHTSIYTDHRARYGICFCILYFCFSVMLLDVVLQDYWSLRFVLSKEKLVDYRHSRMVARDWESMRRQTLVLALAKLFSHIMFVFGGTTLLLWVFVESPETTILYYLYILGYTSVIVFQFNRCFTTNVRVHVTIIFASAIVGFVTGCTLHAIPATAGWLYSDVLAQNIAAVSAAFGTLLWSWKDWTAPNTAAASTAPAATYKRDIWVQRNIRAGDDAESKVAVRNTLNMKVAGAVTRHDDGSVMSQKITQLLHRSLTNPNGTARQTPWAVGIIETVIRKWEEGHVKITVVSQEKFAKAGLKDICSFSQLDGQVLKVTAGFLREAELHLPSWQSQLATMMAESLLYHVARVDGMLSHSQAVQAEHFLHGSSPMSKRIELELALADVNGLARVVRKSNSELMRHLCLGVNVDSNWDTIPPSARRAIFARITGQQVALSQELRQWLSYSKIDLQSLEFHLQLTLHISHESAKRYETVIYFSRNNNPGAVGPVAELKPVRINGSRAPGGLRLARRCFRALVTFPLAFVKWVAVISGGGADIERELSNCLRRAYFRRSILYVTLLLWKMCWVMKNFWVYTLLVYHRPALVSIKRLARKGARRAIARNSIAVECRHRTITGFAVNGDDGSMTLEAFDGNLQEHPQDKEPLFRATYDENFRLTCRVDNEGNTSTYNYSHGSRQRWPMSREVVDSSRRTISFYDKHGRTIHGVLSLGSAAYAFYYHYKATPKGSPDLLRADFKPLNAGSKDRLSVFWGVPLGTRAGFYNWAPSEKIRRIVRVIDGKTFVTEVEYHHRRDPVSVTVLEEEDGCKTAIAQAPKVFPEEDLLLIRPPSLMFDSDDVLIHHGLLQVKRMRHAASKKRSIIPHWSSLPLWGVRVYRPVPTWRIRTELWRGWLNGTLDAVTACWIDELVVREEPLLRKYWRARDTGNLDLARLALDDGIDQIASAIELEADVSEVCLLPIKTADLYAMGLGKDANQVTNRPQDCYNDTKDRISVIVNDIGCWPEAPGGVSNCRRDLVNGHSTIRNHVLAECANEFGIPRFQIERNVQSLKLLPLWGLDGNDAHHGLIDNILQSQVDDKIHDTDVQRDIAGVFIPLLKAFVKGARTKRYSRADLIQYTNVMLSISKYYEHKDYNRTWSSREVEDAWAEAWLVPYNEPNISDPSDYFDIERPSFHDFREAMGIYVAYFFIFSIKVPDECPRVFQSTHHGISSLFGMILKYRRGVTFGIWDHAILWRESFDAAVWDPLGDPAGLLPRRRRHAVHVAIQPASQAPDARLDVFANHVCSMWETELGSDRGRLCNRNRFRRKIDPIVNGISNMDSFTPVDKVRTDKPTVVMLSNVQFIKGIKTAILAADVIVHRYGFKDYKLMVYGAKDRQPSYALEMDKLIVKSNLSDNVVLAGFGKPMEVLKDAWLFMNSSVSEGLPLAIGEAALAGVPIVATEVGATALVMTDPNDQERRYGEVVAPNDPVALARAQLNLLCMVGPWTEFTDEGENAVPPTLPDEIGPDDVEWLSRRMYERSDDRRKLGLLSREVVLHSFHGNRYLREHEQMYWIQWHMAKMRADMALTGSSKNAFKFCSPAPLRYTDEEPDEDDVDKAIGEAEAAERAEDEGLLRSTAMLPGVQRDLEGQLVEKDGRLSRISRLLREPRPLAALAVDDTALSNLGRAATARPPQHRTHQLQQQPVDSYARASRPTRGRAMEADTTSRYRSRILREMSANRANPFNSPPSSTGSHGTVSPTMSSVFSDPEGESTRRLNDDIARVTAPRKLPVNWEAAHRKWPEFFSLPAKGRDAPILITGDADTRPPGPKENKPPVNSVRFADDSTQDAWQGSAKTRAQMQPRVDNESDLSSIVSKPPAGALSHHVAAKSARLPSPLAKVHAPRPSDPVSQLQRRPSISNALDRLRRASLSPNNAEQRDRQRESNSPPLSSAKSSMTAVPPSPNSMDSPGHDASHVRSFFMPDVPHLGDFVTGTLKFSGSMKNGVPIFVKHGRVHDRQERHSAAAHAEVDGIEVPQDEEKIFVSMDMIRDEIVSLQEHHDKVQEYAENLQQQVESLESRLRSGKYVGGVSYHHSDEKLVSPKNQLEIEVAALQARLDQASHKININQDENVSLAHERDRAVSRLQSACDDIGKLTRKLSVKEKELESSHKQLETTDQMRHDNDTLRRDLVSLKLARDALELENKSFRADNENLRKDQKGLREEIESLRSDNNNIRRGDDSLINENRSLRSSNKTLIEENEDLRENLDAAQHELDAAREEIDTLRQQVETMSQERTTFQEDNESLVRHNEKYFSENKILRRENSGFERSIHDLHAENTKLKEEIDLLQQQLNHCRPLPKDDFSARLDEETEENMTSAFLMPDITINTNESGPAEATETREMPEMPTLPELTSQSYKTPAARTDTGQETRVTTKHETLQRSRSRATTTSTKHAAQGQKVAFSIPEKSTQSDKNVANRGSKRRNRGDSAQQSHKGHEIDLFHDPDDSTGLQSVDNTAQDQAISLNFPVKDQPQSRQRDWTNTSQKSQQASRHSLKLVVETGVATEAGRRLDKDTCPALSSDARRILDRLCAHNCRNCIVCSRITSHRGVISSAELTSGKKRVTVSRPVPITDRDLTAEDPTIRPSQSPGHALALVIKGLEDEAHHLQLELSRLQAQYNGRDKGLGRRDRLDLAEGIRTLLKRLEVKNDQIYSLYDVLEGQKAAGQAMTEEEVEMTVLNITGMTVRDATSGSENFTWEGIQDAA